ncbi:hypothetical protein GCM10023317_08690 [Actinopolymorpha pittospori]
MCRVFRMSRPPKSGSGLTVRGLDLDSVPDATVYDNGTVLTPRLRLVGTNDLWTLTLTEPATLAADDPALSESTVGDWSLPDTACPDPGDEPATADQRQDAITYAEGQPDVGYVWLTEHQRVLNASFTGDLERHRRELRALYPGPLCVVEAAASIADLRSLQRSLHVDQDVLEARGIVVLGSSIPRGSVVVIAAAAGPEEVDFLKERYGPLLMVTSWLRLLED